MSDQVDNINLEEVSQNDEIKVNLIAQKYKFQQDPTYPNELEQILQQNEQKLIKNSIQISSEIFQQIIEKIEENKQFQQQNQKLTQNLEEIKFDLSHKTEKVNQYNNNIEQLKTEYRNEIQALTQKYEEQIKSQNLQIIGLNQEIAQLKEKIEKTEKVNQNYILKIQEQNQEIQQQQTQKLNYLKQLEEAKIEINKFQQIDSGLSVDLSQYNGSKKYQLHNILSHKKVKYEVLKYLNYSEIISIALLNKQFYSLIQKDFQLSVILVKQGRLYEKQQIMQLKKQLDYFQSYARTLDHNILKISIFKFILKQQKAGNTLLPYLEEASNLLDINKIKSLFLQPEKKQNSDKTENENHNQDTINVNDYPYLKQYFESNPDILENINQQNQKIIQNQQEKNKKSTKNAFFSTIKNIIKGKNENEQIQIQDPYKNPNLTPQQIQVMQKIEQEQNKQAFQSLIFQDHKQIQNLLEKDLKQQGQYNKDIRAILENQNNQQNQLKLQYQQNLNQKEIIIDKNTIETFYDDLEIQKQKLQDNITYYNKFFTQIIQNLENEPQKLKIYLCKLQTCFIHLFTYSQHLIYETQELQALQNFLVAQLLDKNTIFNQLRDKTEDLEIKINADKQMKIYLDQRIKDQDKKILEQEQVVSETNRKFNSQEQDLKNLKEEYQQIQSQFQEKDKKLQLLAKEVKNLLQKNEELIKLNNQQKKMFVGLYKSIKEIPENQQELQDFNEQISPYDKSSQRNLNYNLDLQISQHFKNNNLLGNYEKLEIQQKKSLKTDKNNNFLQNDKQLVQSQIIQKHSSIKNSHKHSNSLSKIIPEQNLLQTNQNLDNYNTNYSQFTSNSILLNNQKMKTEKSNEIDNEILEMEQKLKKKTARTIYDYKNQLKGGLDDDDLAINDFEQLEDDLKKTELYENDQQYDPWNILDFVIVLSSLPQLIGQNSIKITALRSLRILRPLKSVSNIKELRRILITLFGALKDLLNTIIILIFFFLIFAIGGLQMFVGLLKQRCYEEATGIPHRDDLICGIKQCPEGYVCGKMIANPNFGVTNFDNLAYSFLMVFQCVTMEGWTEIMYWLFDSFSIFVVFYFVVLIFIGSFFLLNLTLAVIKAKFTDPEGKKKRKNEDDDDEEIDQQTASQLSIIAMKNWRRAEREYLKKFYIKQRFQRSIQKDLGWLHKTLGPQNLNRSLNENFTEANDFNWDQLQRKLMNQKKIMQQKIQWENLRKNKLQIAIINPYEEDAKQQFKEKTKKAFQTGQVPHQPQGNMIYKLKNSENNQKSQVKFIGMAKQVRISSRKRNNLNNVKNINQKEKKVVNHGKKYAQKQKVKQGETQTSNPQSSQNLSQNFSDQKEDWEDKLENFIEEQQALDFQNFNQPITQRFSNKNNNNNQQKDQNNDINNSELSENVINKTDRIFTSQSQQYNEGNQNTQNGHTKQNLQTQLRLINKDSSNLSILQLKQKQQKDYIKNSLFSQNLNLDKNQIEISFGNLQNQNNQIKQLDNEELLNEMIVQDNKKLNTNPNSPLDSNQNKSSKYEIVNDIEYHDLLNDSDFQNDQAIKKKKKLGIQTVYDYTKVLKRQAKETNYVKYIKNNNQQQIFTFSDEDIQLAQQYELKKQHHQENNNNNNINKKYSQFQHQNSNNHNQSSNKKNHNNDMLSSRYKNFQNSLMQSNYQFSNNISHSKSLQPAFKRGSKYNLLNQKLFRLSQLSSNSKISKELKKSSKGNLKKKFVSAKKGHQIYINPDSDQEISDEDYYDSLEISSSSSESESGENSNSMDSSYYDSQVSEGDEYLDTEQEKKFQMIDKRREDWEQQQQKNKRKSQMGKSTASNKMGMSKSSRKKKNSKSLRKSDFSNGNRKSVSGERRVSRFQQMQLNKKKYLQEEKIKILAKKKQEEEKKRKIQEEIDKKNVFKFKIIIDMENQYVSNSLYDVLVHRLEQLEAQKQEDEHEQIQQKKYQLKYRLKRNEDEQKKSKNKKKKKKKWTNSYKTLKSRQSLLKSSETLQNSSFSSLSFAARLLMVDGRKNIPIRRTNRVEQILHSKSGTFTPTLSQKIELEQEKKKKRREVPLENEEEEIELTYRNLRRVIREKIPPAKSALLIEQPNFLQIYEKFEQQKLSEQAQPSSSSEPQSQPQPLSKEQKQDHEKKLEALKKELYNYNLLNHYQEIKKKDFITGQKIDEIWSGSEVLADLGPPKHQNNLLKKLSTDKQDLRIWLPGFQGHLLVAHKHLRNFVSSSPFNSLMTTAVMLNTVVLAMDGLFESQKTVDLLNNFNTFFTYLFISEMALKIVGLTPVGYVRDKMNVFDGVIVLLSIFELIFFSGKNSAVSAFRALRILRTFRVLRVTRLLRGLQFMAKIIQVIQRTMDDFVWVAVLLFLFIFIYSLLGMQIYGGEFDFPDNDIRQNFDNFVNSFIVVFQLITMENWQQILTLTFRSSVYKIISAIYLISWIWIGNFIFLNLFLSILLDGFVLEDDDSNKEYEIEESEYIYESEEQPTHNNSLLMLTQQNNLNSDNLVVEEPIKQSYYIRMSTEEEEEIKRNVIQEKQKHKKPIFDGVKCQQSLFFFSQQNWIRIFLYKKCVHPLFEHIILTFIIISSFKLVVDTYINPGSEAEQISEYIDFLFNAVFIVECVVKIISFGLILDDGSYLQDNWNRLDFFIVASSIIDMSFESVDLPVIKILRLLRTLRPLRFISHNKNMKIVIIALLSSINPILNVLIVIFMVWIMFAILGISLLGDRMNYCNVPQNQSYYNINYQDCIDMGYEWKQFDLNYDNIFTALNSLFVISSLEGWPDYMYQAIDSQSYPSGPIENSYTQICIFFIIFILIGSFFLVNLFVGVIFMYFDEAQKNEKINILVTPEQQRWIEFQEMLIGVKAQFQANDPPSNKLRYLSFKISESGYFEAFIMICIILNIVTMGMVYDGQGELYTNVLEAVNLVFTSVFIGEMVIKLLGYGFKGYWMSSWNKFDAFVVIASIVDIILTQLGTGISLLRVGPQLIRIMRVLRVSRLLKLVKSMKDLHSIIETLIFCMPSIINVAALLFLFFFIFSVLGVFLFKDVTEGQVINEYVNFKNFGYAMLTLFRCSTGEDWALIMFDCSRTKNCVKGKTCGTIFSIPYYLVFILVTQFIMLNLFIMIIVQFFEEYNLSEENSMNTFNEKIGVFRHYWSKYSKWSKGEKIKQKQCASMLSELPEPLGYGGSVEVAEIFRDVMSWKLEGDGNGNYYFNEFLYACMKKAYGFKEMNQASNDIKLYLQKYEADTKIKLQEKKRKLEQEQRQKVFELEAETMSGKKRKQVNPMVLYLFTIMAFKAWKTYSRKDEMPWLDISSSNSENESDEEDLEIEEQNSDEVENQQIPEVQEDLEDEDQNQQIQQYQQRIPLHSSKRKIGSINNTKNLQEKRISINRQSHKKLTYQPQNSRYNFSRQFSKQRTVKSINQSDSDDQENDNINEESDIELKPQRRDKSYNTYKNTLLQAAQSKNENSIDIDVLANQIQMEEEEIMQPQIGNIKIQNKNRATSNSIDFTRKNNNQDNLNRRFSTYVNPKSQHITSITRVNENALKFIGQQLRNKQHTSSFSQQVLLKQKLTVNDINKIKEKKQ
ncbi:hypothetical protein PPERSA_08956 [Pseudocohnilembus persalinus]|uniref:Ion transport domain-containing protein n=1 Tax=Pseudocohnilembus persalinus TaxID=266149 RepID=A0A0V0R2X0_PSEPJ|nr:hypothetical protein PPERSA_08956 [Pseudocohnilembus persalinus]|eukprot:KRX08852.1 hypothetical protein PPERSA_08956 [Pseudocohnilembus persalinus]